MRLTPSEQLLIALALLAGACPRRCVAQDVRISAPLVAELVVWWTRAEAGCAFGEVRGDTTIITALHQGTCEGAIGDVQTGPAIPDSERAARLGYLQWALSKRPTTIAFLWIVHDTVTVDGVLLPRIVGVRRVRPPVLGS